MTVRTLATNLACGVPIRAESPAGLVGRHQEVAVSALEGGRVGGRELSTLTSNVLGPDDKGYPIDPGRPGSYPVCDSGTLHFPSCDKEPLPIIVYAPGEQMGINCRPVLQGCPMVVLFNARPCVVGTGTVATYYQGYEGLARHLASYGYVVACIGYGVCVLNESDLPEGYCEVLADFLHWVDSGAAGISQIISHQLVILGHSRGGRFGIENYLAFKKEQEGGGLGDWTFEALILLAPAVTALDEALLFSNGGSFLGLNVYRDSDQGSNGSYHTNPPPKRKTGVTVFESLAGFSGVKHHAQAIDIIPDLDAQHFFQNTLYARSYVLAFLNAYVRKIVGYRAFFREQHHVPSIGSGVKIQHLHAERSSLQQLVLNVKYLSPDGLLEEKGVLSKKKTTSDKIDSVSLSTMTVLQVDFSLSQGALVTVPATSPIKPKFTSIAIALAQSRVVYDENLKTPDVDVAIGLRLWEEGGRLIQTRFESQCTPGGA